MGNAASDARCAGAIPELCDRLPCAGDLARTPHGHVGPAVDGKIQAHIVMVAR